MGHLAYLTIHDTGQIERGDGILLNAYGMVLKDGNAGYCVYLPWVVGRLPALLLIGAKHVHQLVRRQAQIVTHGAVRLVVGGTQHDVGDLTGTQVVTFP